MNNSYNHDPSQNVTQYHENFEGGKKNTNLTIFLCSLHPPECIFLLQHSME